MNDEFKFYVSGRPEADYYGGWGGRGVEPPGSKKKTLKVDPSKAGLPHDVTWTNKLELRS